MKKIFGCLLCFLCLNSFSQNVGINTTAPSAYGHGGTNRLVEIYNENFTANSQAHLLLTDSSVSGAVGSVTWASRAISNSEKRVGIIAAQFDATATPASPKSYLRFYTHNGSLINENFTINPTGNIGIGIASPAYKLHLGNANSSLRIEGPSSPSTGGPALSIGGFGDFQIDKPGIVGGRFIIKENGNVGINNSNPNAPLSFAPALGKKITLYPGATGDVGFGVSGNRLQIYSDNPNADVAIGYDAAGTFNEKFSVKPTGALALSGNIGNAGQVLQSNGNGAATWTGKPYVIYFNQTDLASFASVWGHSNEISLPIPGLDGNTFTLAQNCRIVFNTTLYTQNEELIDAARFFTDVQILNSANVVVERATCHNIISGGFEKENTNSVGIGILPAGTYTIRALYRRNSVNDGESGTYVGSIDPNNRNYRGGQMIIEVFPE